MVTCSRCSAVFDPAERCPAERGMGRCMEQAGHDGWHWSEVGGKGLLRWTGLYSVRGCPARLSLSDWCQLPVDHAGAHNNGRGTTFWPEEDMIAAQQEVPAQPQVRAPSE